jgi:hypothetical protein
MSIKNNNRGTVQNPIQNRFMAGLRLRSANTLNRFSRSIEREK